MSYVKRTRNPTFPYSPPISSPLSLVDFLPVQLYQARISTTFSAPYVVRAIEHARDILSRTENLYLSVAYLILKKN